MPALIFVLNSTQLNLILSLVVNGVCLFFPFPSRSHKAPLLPVIWFSVCDAHCPRDTHQIAVAGAWVQRHGHHLLGISVVLCEQWPPSGPWAHGGTELSTERRHPPSWPQTTQPFLETSWAYCGWDLGLGASLKSVQKLRCGCAELPAAGPALLLVLLFLLQSLSILRLLLGFLVLTEGGWFHLKWKQKKTATRKHWRRAGIKSWLKTLCKMNANGLCSVLIY